MRAHLLPVFLVLVWACDDDPLPPYPDAGVTEDAGTADAGAETDAGAADAGSETDASPMDAGERDGAATDASPSVGDAGNDAGAPVVFCGPPEYTPGSEDAAFLWQDCERPNAWSFRVIAGSAEVVRFAGVATSSAPFLSVVPFEVEDDDTFETRFPARVSFGLNVLNTGSDGFDTVLNSAGDLCFGTSASFAGPLLVGATRVPVGLPFDSTGTACPTE